MNTTKCKLEDAYVSVQENINHLHFSDIPLK